jgi:CubicO group peptidase (beta-lactamase class C family)
MNLLGLLAIAVAIVGPSPGLAQPARSSERAFPSPARLLEFERFARAEMARLKIPGMTIGFTKNGRTWIKGFGFADLENRVPASAHSAYRFASVQKSMTAVAVLQLVERGLVELDAEIQRYVPHFPKKPWPILVRQLLGHQGGIPHYVNRAAEQHIKEHRTTREAIAIFEGFDLVAEPGTKYSYSSYGYNLLGAAIEGASGQAYGDYLRAHVWRPAGMTATSLDDPLALIPNRVRGYQLVDGQLKNSEFIDVSSRFAAGGTRGTVIDLLRFLEALNLGRLLSPASVSLMYAPLRTRDGQVTTSAMGWQRPPGLAAGVVVNDGGQQETRTFILNYPEKRFGMAMAMNLEADVYAPIVLRLYEMVIGEKLFRVDAGS